MTLFFDGIWWLITRGFFRVVSVLVRWLGVMWPVWFSVDERQRRLHTFVVGRTGVGKSVLLHNLIRHYLVWNQKPSVVLFDPHGDLASGLVKFDPYSDGCEFHHSHEVP